MRAVDQRSRQFEPGTQTRFSAGHASIVGLMVIASQVQHAMQHQNL
jgi:hypothetical protein